MALKVEILSNGRTYKLLEQYVMVFQQGMVIVPTGFETDFASTPRFLWRLYPPMGEYCPAALIHDWLYYTGEYTRLESDRLFVKALKIVGASWITQRIFYCGVRIGGWIAWNRHRDNDKE